MWLIIKDSGSAVVGTLAVEPIAGSYVVGVTFKEWNGVEPEIDDINPTLSDPDYPDFEQSGVDFRDLYAQAATEITWLDANIPLVLSADLANLRTYLERVMCQNRQMIKAWRYTAKRIVR
jgi:hypothetical protein